MAEAGIFGDRDGVGFESGDSAEVHGVADDFDGTAEGGLEAGVDGGAEAGVLDEPGAGEFGEDPGEADEEDEKEASSAAGAGADVSEGDFVRGNGFRGGDGRGDG